MAPVPWLVVQADWLRPGGFRSVVVVCGHMVDRPDRGTPRFPANEVDRVAREISEQLDHWGIGAGTLLVCGGARGADILAAERAVAVGADAWLLLALPEDEFVEASVELPGTDWLDRFRHLRQVCPTWVQRDELGPSEDDVFERNNRWCLDVAGRQALDGPLYALVVWDGLVGDGPGGTADFVAEAEHRGTTIEVITPMGPAHAT